MIIVISGFGFTKLSSKLLHNLNEQQLWLLIFYILHLRAPLMGLVRRWGRARICHLKPILLKQWPIFLLAYFLYDPCHPCLFDGRVSGQCCISCYLSWSGDPGTSRLAPGSADRKLTSHLSPLWLSWALEAAGQSETSACHLPDQQGRERGWRNKAVILTFISLTALLQSSFNLQLVT